MDNFRYTQGIKAFDEKVVADGTYFLADGDSEPHLEGVKYLLRPIDICMIPVAVQLRSVCHFLQHPPVT